MPNAIAIKTIRTSLPAPLYRRFRLVTILEGTTMSAVIREAIEARVRASLPMLGLSEANSETGRQQPVGSPLPVHDDVRTSDEAPCTDTRDHQAYGQSDLSTSGMGSGPKVGI
jgi:hypothetical protein